MNKVISLNSKIILYIFFSVFIFMMRIIFFAAQFGGVEHDSGWYLGIAKNLAHKGLYASYTNTIKENGVGAYSSIHGRYSVQDENGYSYFPAGVTVGPGYVIPEAILIKIFGDGWWQYRLWPLIGFVGLLLVLFSFTYLVGGLLALLLFQVWLWIIPQMTTAFAYEAYSEHIATLYLLISFFCIFFSLRKKEFSVLYFFSGLFFSFSVLTKTLFTLEIISFVPIFFWNMIAYKKQWKLIILSWVLFFIGVFLPVVLFELYRFIYLTQKFGFEAWNAINNDIKLTFQSGGSGITNIDFYNLDWAFISKKFLLWKDVAIDKPIIAWILYISSPLFIWNYIERKNRIIVTLFLFASFIIFFWYLFISPSGWARHVWPSLIMGMTLISIIIGILIRRAVHMKNFLLVSFIIVILLVSIRIESIWLSPIIDHNAIMVWDRNRFIRGLEGYPSQPILSLDDQKKLINFFEQNIYLNDNIYYIGWFLNAEISPLVDKVFFPLDRYLNYDQNYIQKGKSIAIFGPYQQGFWSIMPTTYVPIKTSQLCDTIIFKNNSYTLCNLKKNLIYKNSAYN